MKNKLKKLLILKGARQKDLYHFLKEKGIPKISRQHVSVYVLGAHNPRRKSMLRAAICEFFNMEDKDLFDNNY